MGKLLDHIKQGLRSLGRGSASHRPALTGRTIGDDAIPTQRLRTELGPAVPRAVTERDRPTATPPAQSTRQRHATLSKARRSAPGQNALSIWGFGPSPLQSVFEDTPPAEASPLLTASTLGQQAQPPSAPAAAEPSGGFLQGASLFGSAPEAGAERTREWSLFGPPDQNASDDRTIDRLFN